MANLRTDYFLNKILPLPLQQVLSLLLLSKQRNKFLLLTGGHASKFPPLPLSMNAALGVECTSGSLIAIVGKD